MIWKSLVREGVQKVFAHSAVGVKKKKKRVGGQA